MPESGLVTRLTNLFPQLEHMAPDLQERLATGKTVQARSGSFLFGVGDLCSSFLLLLEGSVRVYLSSVEGREISLYRIEPGQTCLLTTSCLMGQTHYPAIGRAESDIKGIALSNRAFNELIVKSPEFRELVFNDFGSRLAIMLRLMQEVSFQKLDLRLGQFLLGNDLSKITHQEIALELGTVREIISRLLKQFQLEGLVKLHRNRIEILDRIALSKRSS